MAYTKEEVVQKLILAYKTCSKEKNLKEIPISSIIQKTSFKQDERNEIFNLFNLNSYEEILLHTNLFDVFTPQGKTHKVVKIKQTNATSEETKMAENTTTKSLHDRIKSLRDALTSGLYEKDEAVRLALLTAIAGESVFFLGAPGCAKSMIARRVVQAFKADGDKGVKYFETLLNQFSTPEEVFGNISLKALNGELEDENGNKKEEYRRLTENMLPEADIAFLDEIWKASPAILNTLLTIINERKFHNGSKVMDVPLKALFAASNELPAKDRGLEALYDRFILRLCVDYIESEDSFFDMIDGSSSSDFALSDEVKNLQITNEELKAWKEKIDAVSLSDEAKAVISAIRKELVHRNNNMGDEDKKNGELFEVGDRRWKKIAHILKTSAFLNDRSEVDLMDCQLIEYCIWSTEKQQKQARGIVEKCIKQNGVDCDSAIEDVEESIREFNGKINETFYEPEYVTIKGSPVIEKISNEDCYEVVSSDGETFYVGSSYYYTSKSGNARKRISSSSRHIEGKTITWEGDSYYDSEISGTINYTPDTTKPTGRLVKNTLFKNISALSATRKAFDETYNIISENIASEIKKLDEFAAEKSSPYKANLFADQFYSDVIMNAVIEAKKALQDAQVDLDKKRAHYQS